MVQILNPVPTARTLRQQAFQEGLDRAMGGIGEMYNQHTQNQLTKRQQAFDSVNTAIKLREAGYDVSPEQVQGMMPKEKSFFSSFLPGEEEAQLDQSSLLSKRTPEYLQGVEDKKIEREIQQQRLKNLKGGKYSAGGGKSSPVTGYSTIEPGAKITTQDVEAVKKSDIATKNVVDRINSLAEKIKTHGISSGLNLTKGDLAVESDIADLQVEMKNLAELGALSGPDLDLVNASIANLSGPLDKLNPLVSREDIINQLKDIAGKAVNRSKNIAEIRGLKREKESVQFIDPYVKQMSREEKIKLLEGR